MLYAKGSFVVTLVMLNLSCFFAPTCTASAPTPLAIALDYSFFVGDLDSSYRPVTRVNGYLRSASVAKCYFSVQYLADVPEVVYVGRFFGPDGKLVNEGTGKGNPRKAGDTSTWSWPTDQINKVQNNVGIWRFEVYLGTNLMFVEYFSVGDYLFYVSATGLSSDLAAKVLVDGKEAGSIRGGERKPSALAVGTHTISVSSLVEVSSDLRYICDRNSWAVSSEGSYTFEYLPSTTANGRFNAAIATLNLINKNLRDPSTGAYYTESRREWTGPTAPTLYAQVRMIEPLLELYLATKNETYLRYAGDSWDFMEKRLKTPKGAYQSASNDPTVDLFINAQGVLALLKMRQVTGDETALKRAREVADYILAYMSDRTNGGFFNAYYENGTRRQNSATWYQATAALMLEALYSITKNSTYLESAEKTQALIDKYMWVDGAGYWSYPNPDWTRKDWNTQVFIYYHQAWVIRNLIALYAATGKLEHLERAKKTADVLEPLWNLQLSGYDAVYSNGTRFTPARSIYAAYVVEALIELARATGEDTYLRQAKRTLECYGMALTDSRFGGAYMDIDQRGRGNMRKSVTYLAKLVESTLLYGYEALLSNTGLPNSLKARVSVDGTAFGQIQGGATRLVSFKFGSSHEIKLDELVLGTEGTRYKCATNAKSVASEGTLSFEYKPQYFLTIRSEYGAPSGEGWYDSGTVAAFSVSSPVGFGVQQIFKAWTGDSTSTTPTATIEMTGPKKVLAVWSTDYTQITLVIVAIFVAAGAGAIVLLRRRKKTTE